MRTNDPLEAIKSLLAHPASDAVISCTQEGLFHVRSAAEEADKGSLPILKREHAEVQLALAAELLRGDLSPPGMGPFPQGEVAAWLKRNWEEWFRKARLNTSLATVNP